MHRINCSSTEIRRHLERLSETIGPRLAGSRKEAEAADYVAREFAKIGAEVSVESFPVFERRIRQQTLTFRLHDQWHEVPCSTLNGSESTDAQRIEAPLVVVEPPELRRSTYTDFEGKAVLLLGTHIETPAFYERLMRAKPAFLMLVDTRYPTDTLRADGLFPAYIHRYGSVPTVAIPFMRAWHLHGSDRAKLMIDGERVEASSQNVIATLPGTQGEPRGPVLFAGGHHDTQADSPGADDNGSGVAAVLELARVLAPLPRKREIRLISFGAEEQLSVGSAAYVRSHRNELEHRGGFMCNFDGFGSKMGWYKFHVCAEERATEFFINAMESQGFYAEICRKPIPYQDAFPFYAAGIPGFWLYRANCTSGRFYHHQADDNLEKMDTERMARVLSPMAKACAELAAAQSPLPFPLTIPNGLQQTVHTYWEDCFGGWEGFSPG